LLGQCRLLGRCTFGWCTFGQRTCLADPLLFDTRFVDEGVCFRILVDRLVAPK
jgi:hypothetical protein